MATKKAPEFWFDKKGQLWFAHDCTGPDGTFTREYTLPEVIYEIVKRDPLTVLPPIFCGLCKLRGTILDGEFVESESPAL